MVLLAPILCPGEATGGLSDDTAFEVPFGTLRNPTGSAWVGNRKMWPKHAGSFRYCTISAGSDGGIGSGRQ